MSIRLLDNVALDTDGAAFDLPAPTDQNKFNEWPIYVWATAFGGGTVTIQVSPDGGVNWFTARTPADAQAIFTQSDHMILKLKSPKVRARLTGSVGASGVNAYLG